MVEKSGQQNNSAQPIVDLQVYAPTPAPMKKAVNPKNFIPINTSSYGVQVAPNLQFPYVPMQNLPFSNVINPIPLIKNYNITIGGADGDHAQINAIYEDILPEKYLNNTFSTILERKNILQYIRSIFIKQYDGEDVQLGAKGENSLLRYIKFLDLNPYNPNMLSANPYKGLPDNMLLYRSCYPIRKNNISNTVQCAARSLGLNVRIYRLTNQEYLIKKQNDIDIVSFDVWRELAYYEYIREYIVKKGICPNFSIMYGYYISQNCDIDFNKVNMMKRNIKCPMNNPRFVVRNNDGILDGSILPSPPPAPNMINTYRTPINTGVNINNVVPMDRIQTGGSTRKYALKQTGGNLGLNNIVCPTNPNKTIEKNMDAYSGKGLVLLTEAPASNLVTWASKAYKVNGNVRQMLNTGFHSAQVWFSILFQIMAALCTLQFNNIGINEFSILDNVYIKELYAHENTKKFWIYNINGVEYFIPNYGFLVLIDSNFKDMVNQPRTSKISGLKDIDEGYNMIRKVYGHIFKDDVVTTNNVCINAFRNAFTPNIFSNAFINEGGSPPADEVMTLLSKINKDASSDQIEYYLITYMHMFMNNRVGSILKEDEIVNIQKENGAPFKRGQIIVHEFAHNTYKFVLYLGTNSDNTIGILTSEDKTSYYDRKSKIIAKSITSDQVYNYSVYEQITQNYTAGELTFSDNDLLEIYSINRQS
jgi:hypothetical protein